MICGIHIVAAPEETLRWAEGKLFEFELQDFIGAHFTDIEPVYRFRSALKLERQHVVVGAVGATFVLGEGIQPRAIAR